ncbi:MAG: hypothetical protein ACRDC2_09360 [Plesiomonas shigelloides]
MGNLPFSLGTLAVSFLAPAAIYKLVSIVLKYLESSRQYKIKNLEIIGNLSSSEEVKELLIEHSIKSAYGVDMPHHAFSVIVKNNNRAELIPLYDKGRKYLRIDGDSFLLDERFASRTRRYMETIRIFAIWMTFYLLFSAIFAMVFTLLLSSIQTNAGSTYSTTDYILIFFLFVICIASLYGAITIFFTKTRSVESAHQFIQLYEKGKSKVPSKPKWTY